MASAAEIVTVLSSPLGMVWLFIIGASLGSFANVCIYRWAPTAEHPLGISVVSPASRCGFCATPIHWYDNIPVLSYLLLKGKCRSCKTGFSPRYCIIEAVFGIITVALAWSVWSHAEPPGDQLYRLGVYVLFAFVLMVAGAIDWDTGLILNKITYFATPLFLAFSLFLGGTPPWFGALGMAVGFLLLWGTSRAYFLLTKRVGLGDGDIKLIALIGTIVGVQGVAMTLTFASVLGLVVGTALAFAAKRKSTLRHFSIRFGPFLAAGAILYLLFRNAAFFPLF